MTTGTKKCSKTTRCSSIINTCPPSREHIPRHSTQSQLLFFFRLLLLLFLLILFLPRCAPLFFPSVLLPSLPGSRAHSSSPLPPTYSLTFHFPIACDDALNVSSLSLSSFRLCLLAYTRCYIRLLLSSLIIHHARYVGSLKARTKRHPVEKTKSITKKKKKNAETKSDD